MVGSQRKMCMFLFCISIDSETSLWHYSLLSAYRLLWYAWYLVHWEEVVTSCCMVNKLSAGVTVHMLAEAGGISSQFAVLPLGLCCSLAWSIWLVDWNGSNVPPFAGLIFWLACGLLPEASALVSWFMLAGHSLLDYMFVDITSIFLLCFFSSSAFKLLGKPLLPPRRQS